MPTIEQSDMQRQDQPLHVRVFISSPGDVPQERALARQVLENLPYDPAFRGKLSVEIVAWDQPSAPTPMLATLTPQEAINQGLPLPSACDVVIVLFWARMGTPLPPEYKKPDGARYLSGTEWEYEDGVSHARQSAQRGDRPVRPQVLVYRRTEDPIIKLNDPEREKKIE